MTNDAPRSDLHAVLENLVVNSLSRVFGFVVRISIISCGAVLIAFSGIGLAVFIVLWTFLPAILLTLLLYGVILIFS